MKKVLIAFLALTFLTLSASETDARRKRKIRFRNKEIALIEFSFKVDSRVRGKMRPYEALFPQLPARISQGDAVIFKLKSYTYETFQRQAERQLQCMLMPLNAFGKQWSYDEYGFPDTNIEMAQRRGDATYYLKLEVDVLASPESSIQLTGRPKIDTPLKPKDYLRPNVKVKSTFYRKRGVLPYAVYQADYQWETPIILQPTMLDGLVNVHVRADRTSVKEIIDMAISAIIDEIQSGRNIVG